jgi:1,4-dihydroxy-2-naphthoate polyprenyltransferase
MKRLLTMWHVVAAGRLYFLAGGVLMYTLGAGTAWYERGNLAAAPLLLGLLVVLMVQMMTNYVNEYWDSGDDAQVSLRTPFSGGSGVAAAGQISAATLYQVSALCAITGALLTATLAVAGHLTWLSLSLIVLAACGGIAYSQPPWRLVARGMGELSAALIVCFLTPLVAYSLQADGLSRRVVLTCLPVMAMQFAMLLAIEFPDYAADRATGKRNLVVRLGPARAAWLYDGLVLLGFLLAALSGQGRTPAWAGLLPQALLPVALLQMWLVHRVTGGDATKTALMAFFGVALFVVFAGLLVAGILLPLLGGYGR